jgi:hypothetical protein
VYVGCCCCEGASSSIEKGRHTSASCVFGREGEDMSVRDVLSLSVSEGRGMMRWLRLTRSRCLRCPIRTHAHSARYARGGEQHDRIALTCKGGVSAACVRSFDSAATVPSLDTGKTPAGGGGPAKKVFPTPNMKQPTTTTRSPNHPDARPCS